MCLENLYTNYLNCEKYNYEYLIKNPPLNINIEKINEFLLFTLKSKVFKDAFELLTGRDNYEKIFNNNIISEFINNIKYLPIKFSTVSALFDRLSFTAFIPTMKKKIYATTIDLDNDETISFTLENGIIVAIIFHEFGHSINVMITFKENHLKCINSPRKKYLKFKEGGYYLEFSLFGRIIKNLSYGEALYILNLDNYKKSLNEFREGFMQLSQTDLIMKGPFSDYNLEDELKINEYKNSFFIKAKDGNESIDILNDIKISIPLRNDIPGRKIDEKDLEPYF